MKAALPSEYKSYDTPFAVGHGDFVELEVALLASCDNPAPWLAATLIYEWLYRDLADPAATFSTIPIEYYGNGYRGSLKIPARNLGPSLFKIKVDFTVS